MYVVSVCQYIRMCIQDMCKCVGMYVYVCVPTYVCVYVCMCVYVYVHICMCVYNIRYVLCIMCAYVYLRVCCCMCVYVWWCFEKQLR